MLLRTTARRMPPPDTQHSPCPHHHHTRCVSSLHMQHVNTLYTYTCHRGNEPAVLSCGQFTSTPTSYTLSTQHKSEYVKHRRRMRRRGQINTWHAGCRVRGPPPCCWWCRCRARPVLCCPRPPAPHSAAAAQLVSSRGAVTIHSVHTQTSLVSP